MVVLEDGVVEKSAGSTHAFGLATRSTNVPTQNFMIRTLLTLDDALVEPTFAVIVHPAIFTLF